MKTVSLSEFAAALGMSHSVVSTKLGAGFFGNEAGKNGREYLLSFAHAVAYVAAVRASGIGCSKSDARSVASVVYTNVADGVDLTDRKVVICRRITGTGTDMTACGLDNQIDSSDGSIVYSIALDFILAEAQKTFDRALAVPV